MRILAIRGQNLASLQRAFELQLDAPPLGGTGLFAITGPVGAGKSTLLDALCLPLFDRTPRLSGRGGAAVGDPSQPPGDWLSSNDPRTLLRRGAATGFAEVDFVGRDGECYRARWHVRRARHRPEGRVQDQELQLTTRDGATVVASGRKTEVLAAIQDRLGLDFAQFCRSVLLAQGEFAAFLHADSRQRAQLLETLTGAEVYRALSKRAHERRRDREQHRAVLLRQIEGQPALDDAARVALETSVAKLGAELELHRKAVEVAQRYVTWYQAAARLRQRESEATVALERAKERLAAAEPARQRLQRLQRAHGAWPQAVLLADREGRFAAARAALAQTEAVRDAAQTRARQLAAAVDEALGEWRAEDAQDGVPPIAREFPVWREPLRAWQRAAARIAAGEQRVRELAAKAAARNVELAAAAAAHVQAGGALAAAQDELAAARAASAPFDGEDFVARRRRIETARAELGAAVAAVDAWRVAAAADAAARAQLARATALRDERIAALGPLAARQEAAAAALVGARAGLEVLSVRRSAAELAQHLHAGEPCPLCGSAEHPSPARYDASAFAAAAAAETAAQAAFDAARAAVAEHEKQCVRAEAEWQAANGRLAEAGQALATAAQRWRELRPGAPATGPEPLVAALAADLGRWQLDADAFDAAAAAAQAARARLDAAQTAERAAADARHAAATAADAAAGAVAAANAEAQDAGVECEERRQELREATERLVPAFAGVAAWQEKLHLAGATTALEGLAARVAELAAQRAELARAEAAVADARAAVDRTGSERDAAAAQYAVAVAAAGVAEADVAELRDLPPGALQQEQERLQQLATAVDRERAVVQQLAASRREHEHDGRPSLEEHDAPRALDEARAARRLVQEELDRVRAELGADDLLRRHRAELAPELAAAERELATWAALDGLIGSSDGSAFAVFAQSVTLEVLLVEANRRLEELARRYRLEKNPTADLDFVVVDLDLGGARRSLQTLSGGETFLVSLALALALATLAAPRVRVETLFLDEGFGTLDAQSLEVALGALDSLQAAGCQVGIISHVDGIAERIGTVVEVVPEGGGRSAVRVRAG